MKFEKIQVGQVLFDVHSERMGNTTMRTMGCWQVKVVSIDSESRTAMASWNHSPPSRWSARRLEKLRAKAPKFERTICGGLRIKRKQRVDGDVTP